MDQNKNEEYRKKLNQIAKEEYGEAYEKFLETLDSQPTPISPPDGDHIVNIEISVQNPRGKIDLKTTQKWIDNRWEELKEKHGRGNKKHAFDELIKDLQGMSVNLKKNNIDPFDYVKFDSAYRQRKNRK